jgi:uroporphyrinogen decarboxylase
MSKASLGFRAQTSGFPKSGTEPVSHNRLLRALNREPVDCTPVWFMRQAGRVLPEYRAIREKYDLLAICQHPEICAEVTLQPVHHLGVDAAILFADIMTPLIGIGIDLQIVDAVGPVIAKPVRSYADLARLRSLEPETDIPYVLQTIQLVEAELNGTVPLLGFAGAPFTLATYLIEGRSPHDFANTKRMMYAAPKLWDELMTRLADIVTTYLRAQIAAGVQAVQLFDSWVGVLSPDDYRRYVQPYSARVFTGLTDTGVPTIHFGTETATLLAAMCEAGGTTIGIDWRIPLDDAWARIGYERGIQGNLDPMVLLGPVEHMETEARRIIDRAAGRPGHIFNLGHGVHPETPVDMLKQLVEVVHSYTPTDTKC